jgi:hypothetical protein
METESVVKPTGAATELTEAESQERKRREEQAAAANSSLITVPFRSDSGATLTAVYNRETGRVSMYDEEDNEVSFHYVANVTEFRALISLNSEASSMGPTREQIEERIRRMEEMGLEVPQELLDMLN